MLRIERSAPKRKIITCETELGMACTDRRSGDWSGKGTEKGEKHQHKKKIIKKKNLSPKREVSSQYLT